MRASVIVFTPQANGVGTDHEAIPSFRVRLAVTIIGLV